MKPRKPNKMDIPRRTERVLRMGGLLGCGFSYRTADAASSTTEWGRRDIRDHCYILVYVLTGRGVYEDEQGNAFEIGAGSVYQRFPSLLHASVFDPRVDFAECYLVLPPQIHALLESAQAISVQRPGFQVGVDAFFYHRFEALFLKLKTCPDRELPGILAEAHLFATELLRAGAEEPDLFLEKASALLSADFRCERSLEDVGRRVGMSYAKFRQMFREKTGISPGAWRNRKRMEHAQHFLAEDSAQIKVVAERLGYPDVYSFSKQFKQHTGQTPGAFKRARHLG